MASKEDLSFGFNTKFFEAGMNRINKKFDSMKNTAVNVSKGVVSGIGNMTKKLLVLGGGIKGIKSLFSQIPEIGKAFSIAKETIMRNFLFPLRKAIFPLLQKFLNYIRDNRKTFVVWGQQLAGVFNIVVSGMKGIFKVGKKLSGFFLNFINTVFGTQLKSFQDLINLTIFKIAIAVEFLKSSIGRVLDDFQPFIDQFGSGLNSIIDVIKTVIGWIEKIGSAFLEGISPSIKELEAPFNRIADAFKKLFGDEKRAKQWEKLFNVIGKVVGDSLVFAFEAIATAVEIITWGIGKMLDLFDSAPFQKFLGFAGDIAGKVGGFFKGAFEGIKGFFTGEEKVDDAIITKRGEVIKTNPEDNILAFKKFPVMAAPGSGGGGGVTTGDFNFSITVNVADATKEQATIFGGDIVNIIRQKLNSELVRIGAV